MKRIILLIALLVLLPGCVTEKFLTPRNWGQEWYTTPGPFPAQTCSDSICIELTAPVTIVASIAYNLTNYLDGQAVLFVLIASADGTPWHPNARRLYSTVIPNANRESGLIPGPYRFSAGTQIFWAAGTYQELWDKRFPHLEQQTTLYLREP
jgi:hypothetical protein